MDCRPRPASDSQGIFSRVVAKTWAEGVDMSTAREEILGRIRHAMQSDGATRNEDYAAIRREYRQAGSLDPEQKLRLFEDRLGDYEAAVYRCTADRIAETVAKALAVREKRRLVIPENVPKSWLAEGFDFVLGDLLTH